MARADLLALTDDALTQLANAGLVKRCRRDREAGKAPALSEHEDGLIEARFDDGALTRLKPGAGIAEASCSCPASGVCRHRVALAMAYRAQHAAAAPQDWDPAGLDVGPLEAALGSAARAELAKLRASRLSAQLQRAAPPSAALPMANVRFLVPHDIKYARCDCVQQSGCVHVIIAVEAFRGVSAQPPIASATRLCEAGDAVLTQLLREGTTAGMAAHAAGIKQAQAQAAEASAVWFALALEALAEQIAAYDARSALYDEDEVLALALEIYARPRAQGVEAMGFGEPLETAMAKTRLTSLGARITQRGKELRARVALADTDTGATMLLERRFAAGEAAARPVAPGLTLRALARGQVLTVSAKRRADGSVSFGAGSSGKTTLVPRGAVLELPSLVVADPAALKAQWVEAAPLYVQPRNQARGFRVFNVVEVLGQSWRPGAQEWLGAVRLEGYEPPLLLKRTYDAGAPQALDHLAEAFGGRRGALRQVAGLVSLENQALWCEPWSLACDDLIVPDLDAATSGGSLAPGPASSRGPLQALRLALAGALHAGVARTRLRAPEFGRLCADLEGAGYAEAARRGVAALVRSTGDLTTFARAALLIFAVAESLASPST